MTNKFIIRKNIWLIILLKLILYALIFLIICVFIIYPLILGKYVVLFFGVLLIPLYIFLLKFDLYNSLYITNGHLKKDYFIFPIDYKKNFISEKKVFKNKIYYNDVLAITIFVNENKYYSKRYNSYMPIEGKITQNISYYIKSAKTMILYSKNNTYIADITKIINKKDFIKFITILDNMIQHNADK